MASTLSFKGVIPFSSTKCPRKLNSFAINVHFGIAYNRVEELIALEGVDICELEKELNVFKGKIDLLEDTLSNILELLPEKDYDTQFEIVEDFRDEAI
ncbi:uncharacterized protein TNIN_340241 [Trichonephila inaurata madagascariensis]|uniref:Uncharacterized protein n=1 Tax=Trichonephila inaurata madagascariensis TaxID=2747483 RepID=A0A8X6XAF3_9ARAC|nr:uncharacterized protein TNIN_340241 [Trichonephila inaurata madagascariensis]